MTALTDADLIAALGWQPCRSFGGSGPCDEHGSAQRLNPSGVCSYQAARLHLVRAGIDLARNGIADTIEAVRELHQHEQCVIHHAPGDLCGRHWCRTCQSSWPCETARILDRYEGTDR